jgi:phosphoribosylamine-glycine ligase
MKTNLCGDYNSYWTCCLPAKLTIGRIRTHVIDTTIQSMDKSRCTYMGILILISPHTQIIFV